MAEGDGEDIEGAGSLPLYFYVYIGNIPGQYHSVDLRSYFSQYIEKGAFRCFHFKHRPETKISASSGSSDKCCAVIQIYNNFFPEVEAKCRKSPWYDRDGKLLEKPSLPSILKMNVKNAQSGEPQALCFNKNVRRERTTDVSKMQCELDILNLPELHPPVGMPQGNVGTSMKTFMMSIRNCKLPSSVIQKLQLQFSKGYSKRLYGSVPFCYDEERGVQPSDVKDCLEPEQKNHPSLADLSFNKIERNNQFISKNIENEEDDAEEWERHEALNDEANKSKERLYEEDIELKWEKGGSGLVFYTDAYYWHEMKGKDFDEDTTNDWDVDTSVYYENGAGDRDMKDLIEIQENSALQTGDCSQRDKKINSYKGHFGRRVLERQGWIKGTGLGRKRKGIIEPIEADGQTAKDKRGLGYLGEKLNRNVQSTRKQPQMEVVIRTCYDEEDKN